MKGGGGAPVISLTDVPQACGSCRRSLPEVAACSICAVSFGASFAEVV